MKMPPSHDVSSGLQSERQASVGLGRRQARANALSPEDNRLPGDEVVVRRGAADAYRRVPLDLAKISQQPLARFHRTFGCTDIHDPAHKRRREEHYRVSFASGGKVRRCAPRSGSADSIQFNSRAIFVKPS